MTAPGGQVDSPRRSTSAAARSSMARAMPSLPHRRAVERAFRAGKVLRPRWDVQAFVGKFVASIIADIVRVGVIDDGMQDIHIDAAHGVDHFALDAHLAAYEPDVRSLVVPTPGDAARPVNRDRSL